MPETLIKVRGVNKTFNLGKVIVLHHGSVWIR